MNPVRVGPRKAIGEVVTPFGQASSRRARREPAVPHRRRFPVNATGQPSQRSGAGPTIVLVHGAFADASCWNGVIERLQQQGSTMRTAPG